MVYLVLCICRVISFELDDPFLSAVRYPTDDITQSADLVAAFLPEIWLKLAVSRSVWKRDIDKVFPRRDDQIPMQISETSDVFCDLVLHCLVVLELRIDSVLAHLPVACQHTVLELR